MKKILLALVICSLVFGFTACNTATVPGGSQDVDSEQEPEPVYNPLTNLPVDGPIEA